MPQRIEVPGHGVVEFPDGMTDAQIVDAIKANPAPKPGAFEGVGAAFRQGLADTAGGVGETLKQTGLSDGNSLKAGAAAVAPVQAPETSLYDAQGLHPENLPRAAAEGAPGLAGVLAAARLGARIPGPAWVKGIGGVLGGTAAGAAMMFGNKAKEAAAERTGDPNAEPTTADKTRAAAVTGAESVVGALPGLKFLPGAGKVTAVGGKGVLKAAQQLAERVGVEGAGGAAQNAVDQAGMSVGTDKGLTVDPTKVINAGLTQAASTAPIAAPRALAEAAGAVRDRNFGGDNASATAAVANRIQRLAQESGASLKQASPVLGAHAEISNELKSATSGLGELDPDAVNALARAKGGTATPADIARIQAATADHPASAQVVDLARQSAMAHALLNRGVISGDKFKGGIAATVGQHLPISIPKAAAFIGGTALATGHLPMFGVYGAPALGALGAGWAAARGIDAMTGRRAPAKGFVDKFANGNVPLRAPVAPQEPDPAQGLREQINDAQSLMAARRANAQLAQPSAQDPKQLIAQMNALVNAHKVMAKNTVNSAMPMLRQLAGTQQQPQAPVDNTTPPGQLKAAMDALVNSRKVTAQQNTAQALPALRELAARSQQPAPTPAPVVPETNMVPKDVLANVRSLMRGRSMVDKMQSQSQVPTAPAAAPEPVAPVISPAVKLPTGVVSNAKTLVKGMTAMNKIKDKADKAQAKADALTAKVQAKAAVKAAAAVEPSVTKIKKSNGKVTVDTPAPTVPQYAPVEAKYHGMTDQAVADRELADKQGEGADVKYPAKYKQNVIKARTSRRNAMAEISADHGDHDQELMADLLEQMHVIRRRSTAIEAVTHYTHQMSPEAAQSVRAKFTPAYINSIWPK